MIKLKKCPGCRKNFKAIRSNQKWCSTACSARTRLAKRTCRWSALVGNISTGCGEFLSILTGLPRVCPFCARQIQAAPVPGN